MQPINSILSLIGQYGYLIVFLGVMLESMGIPLPGETILLAAGLLVHQGTLDPGEAIVFGISGTILGNQIGYRVGRGGGTAVRPALGPLCWDRLQTPREGGGILRPSWEEDGVPGSLCSGA